MQLATAAGAMKANLKACQPNRPPRCPYGVPGIKSGQPRVRGSTFGPERDR
jgi:hypothetical protein